MKKVMVFGVFDLLHPGHVSFLQQAKRYGDYLIVSVARDKNVKKIKNKTPFRNERERVHLIKTLGLANKIVLGGVYDPWPHIKKEQPDIIALGYDQRFYVTSGSIEEFKKELVMNGISTRVVRLKAFKPKIFKTSRLRHDKTLR